MKNSILYRLLRRYVRFCCRFYFRRVEVQGLENVPQEGAIIFAANHQNAFLDAILIHIYQPRAPFFLTRGDVFNQKLANLVLRSLNMRPIFRFRDGIENIKRNKSVFSECYEILERKLALGIFPEGNHNPQFRLRPLQRGCARIALDTELRNNFNLGLKIIPVGIQYYGGQNSRSEVLIQFGAPILVKDYEALKDDEKAFHTTLTHKLSAEMEKLIIHIPPESYDSHFDRWENLRRDIKPLIDRFKEDISIINGQVPDSESNQSLNLKNWLQMPLVVWGALNHLISYPLYLWILRKLVPDTDFLGSIKFGLAMIYFPLVYLLQTLALQPLIGNWTGIYFILLPISGIVFRDWLVPRRNKMKAVPYEESTKHP